MSEELQTHRTFVICSETDRPYAEKLVLLLGGDMISIHFYKDAEAKDGHEFIEKFVSEQLSGIDDVMVLIGPETWKKRLVDLQLYATLGYRNENGSPLGIVGILLPSRPDFGQGHVVKGTIPPRVYDNWKSGKGLIKLFSWKNNPVYFKKVIELTDKRKGSIPEDNSRPVLAKNRGKEAKTWVK